MKQPKPKKKSFQTVLADLFMNFSLALVWLLYLMPEHKEVQTLPDNLPPPTEKVNGDRPGSGQNILKVSFRPQRQETIVHYDGSSYALKNSQELFDRNNQASPDVLVLSMKRNPEWSSFLEAAVTHDLPVTIEFQD